MLTFLTLCDIIRLSEVLNMFAQRLKELRKKSNMTQVQLAERLDVSKGTIAMWETGKRQPNFETLNVLSDIFDKRIDYILGHSDDDSSPNLTEEEIDQLGSWEVETIFKEAIRSYLSLDDYGKTAVENLIRAERHRCLDQQTLCDIDNIVVKIQALPEKK